MNLIYKHDNQLSAWWDLQITKGEPWRDFPIRVVNTTIPFESLKVDRKEDGSLVYSDIEFIEEVSVTLRESPQFEVYDYFNDWINKFYDFKKRVFKTFPSIEAYNDAHYDFTVTYYKGQAFQVGVSLLGLSGGAAIGENGAPTFKTMLPSRQFILKQCKPTSISNIETSYETGEALEFTISFVPTEIEVVTAI